MGVFEVEALADAAQLDIEMPLHELEGHFLAALGNRQVYFAKAAPTEAAPNCVSGDRFVTGSIGEFHNDPPPRKSDLCAGAAEYENYFVAGRQLLCTTDGKIGTEERSPSSTRSRPALGLVSKAVTRNRQRPVVTIFRATTRDKSKQGKLENRGRTLRKDGREL
jgi:hypothetical protein